MVGWADGCLLHRRVPLDLPPEDRLLDEVKVRLTDEGPDSEHFGELLEEHHYLHSDPAMGTVLLSVAEYRCQRVALLTFCSATFRLKPRDKFLPWSTREVRQRRHLIAQNNRFLILPITGSRPNLTSQMLKLVGERLSSDRQQRFGHPVFLLETFVDSQRLRGTCYEAAGWVALASTQIDHRRGHDFYIDTQHPKGLWVRSLGKAALAALQELFPLKTPSRRVLG